MLDGIPVCLSFRVRNPAVLHHFPQGALRLVCLRGVHLAEIEGNANHDVAPHDVAVHVFHKVGRDASLQGLLLVQDVGDFDRKGHGTDFLADSGVPEQLGLAVALQGLIENALKHNASGADRPLDIRIRIDGDAVTVSNNLQPLANPIPSTGTGLQTLGERYRLICGKEISVDRGDDSFAVRLPVITNKDLYESSDH